MMRKFKLAGLVAVAALIPMLMAPSGGFPSFPTFQGVSLQSNTTAGYASPIAGNVTISGSGNPAVNLVDTAQAANNRVFSIQSSAGLISFFACPDSGSGCTVVERITQSTGGVQIGLPTGGDKGVGSINATGVYSAGVQLIPITYLVSGSATTRTSTTTLSCDANLTTAPTLTASKIFHVHAAINWQQGAVTGNGIRVNVGVSGTGAGLSHALFNDDNVTNANPTTSITQTYNGGTSIFQMTDASVVNNSHELIIDGVFQAASSGATTVCISWAQNTSSANATTINATSELDFQQMN